MKTISKEKEELFVKEYVATGNATESAKKCGYGKSSGQMGYYLKKRLNPQIQKGLREVLDSITPRSISVMESLLDSDSDVVKLNTCKFILSDLNGFGKNNIDLTIHEKQQEHEDDTFKIADKLALALDYCTEEDIRTMCERHKNSMGRIIGLIKTASLNSKEYKEILGEGEL